jgi:hypothetical protein
MGQTKTPTNQATVPKQRFNLRRPGIRHHIEILRFPAQKQITNATTNQVSLKTAFLQARKNLQGFIADLGTRNGVIRTLIDRTGISISDSLFQDAG